MIIFADDPRRKYYKVENGERICKESQTPPDMLKELKELDAFYLEWYGEHFIKFIPGSKEVMP